MPLRENHERMRMMTLTGTMIEKLEDKGFNRWTKGNMDRLYIDPDKLGLELSFYNSGNISSAWFDGEKISNSIARQLGFIKLWIDVKTGEVATKGGSWKLDEYVKKMAEKATEMLTEATNGETEAAQNETETTKAMTNRELAAVIVDDRIAHGQFSGREWEDEAAHSTSWIKDDKGLAERRAS